MDASLYFQLRDQIDAATTLETLAILRDRLDAARPHAIERRALERQIERRERTILLPLVEDEVPLLVASEPGDHRAATAATATAPLADGPPAAAPMLDDLAAGEAPRPLAS